MDTLYHDGLRVVTLTQYPGYYAREDGTILSTRNFHNGTRNFTQAKPLKCCINRKTGYRQVVLCIGSKYTSIAVHRLIACAFHGIPKPGQQCRHLDGNKSNNSAINLTWGTPKENNADKRIHGTSRIGEKNPLAKLTNEQAKSAVVQYLNGKTQNEIAFECGVTQVCISRIIRGRSWKSIVGDIQPPDLLSRQPRGIHRYNCKLSENDIRAIRKLSVEGVSQTTIAMKYGITQSHAGKIINKRVWSHVVDS